MKKILSFIIAFLIIIGVVTYYPQGAKAETESPEVSESPSDSESPSSSDSPSPSSSTSPSPSESESPSVSAPVENVDLTIESYTPTSLVGGGDITIKIKITNSGDAIGDAVLTIGGETVATYGTIAAGATKSYNEEYTVSASQLDTDIAVVLSYTFESVAKSKTKTFKVSKEAVNVGVSTTVKADNTEVAGGTEVKFTFAIENTGNVAIENATISASELNGGNALSSAFSIDPGKSTIIPYIATITETTVVEPILKYTANGKNYTKSMQSVTITVEEVLVSVVVSADNTEPEPGEEVNFSIAIVNEGNVSLVNLVLTDKDGNEVPLGSTKLAVGGTLNATYTTTFEENTQFLFNLICDDPSEESHTFSSNILNIQVEEEDIDYESELTLLVDADINTLKDEDKVIFTISLSNTGEHIFTDVSVNENTIGVINEEEIAALYPGDKTFTIEQEVLENTTFYFYVNATDPDENIIKVSANPIEITVDPNTSNGIGTLLWIIAIIMILIIGAGVTLFILVRKDKLGQKTLRSGRRVMRSNPSLRNSDAFSATSYAGYEKKDAAYTTTQQDLPEKTISMQTKRSKRVEMMDIEKEGQEIPEIQEQAVKKKTPPVAPKKKLKKTSDFMDRNNF